MEKYENLKATVTDFTNTLENFAKQENLTSATKQILTAIIESDKFLSLKLQTGQL